MNVTQTCRDGLILAIGGSSRVTPGGGGTAETLLITFTLVVTGTGLPIPTETGLPIATGATRLPVATDSIELSIVVVEVDLLNVTPRVPIILLEAGTILTAGDENIGNALMVAAVTLGLGGVVMALMLVGT